MPMKPIKKISCVVFISLVCLVATFNQVLANEQILNEKELYEVRTLTGQFQPGFLNGNLGEATFTMPSSILELKNGRLIVSDTENHLLRLIENDGVSTFSGNIFDFDLQGQAIGSYNDGKSQDVYYNFPAGIAQDHQGNIYVADSLNHAIRKIAKDGSVLTVAGNGIAGNTDGKGKLAQFNFPSDLVVDRKGNIYVADSLNHSIRKIDKKGTVTTLNQPSSRIVEYFGGALTETGDFKDGPLNEALFNEPSSLAIDGQGNLYVSDTGNQRIRYIDFKANEVTTVAGGGQLARNALYVEPAFKDGTALRARFANPIGIHLASDGSLLIADSNNHVIRILVNGKVSTVVGQAQEDGKVDGILEVARLNQPTDVIERKDGSLIVVDSLNNKIKQIQRYVEEPHQEDGQIHVLINGELMKTDVAPQLVNGRTYVPIRAIAESLGHSVKYDEKNFRADIVISEKLAYAFSVEDTTVKRITEEGEQLLDVKSVLYNSRLLVPVRFISEQFGYDVQWDNTKRHVVIRSKIFE